MVVTDLDGTLLDPRGHLGAANRGALERLGEGGTLRVVATGRSLYSARKVLDEEFPIDYLVFSSGAGILDWPSAELLVVHQMEREHAQGAVDALLARHLDFMVHMGVPDNHHFYLHDTGVDNPDFHRRWDRYRDFALPLDGRDVAHMEVSQLLAIEAPEQDSQFEELVRELDHLNVVLTTSPLDHRSRWIEIFPPEASKSRASEWIRRRHRIPHDAVLAVGNDFNDRDLLDWAQSSYVVANAAGMLKSRYRVVASNDDQGFAEAVGNHGLA
jgi:hydroxymethylpyrimidine pyrophosphatase-like HAD family hydrolase